MKRRAFLRMIGLAPVAVALPAMALPRPDNVKDTVKGSVTMGEQVGEYANIRIYVDPAQGTKRLVISADAFDIAGVNRDLDAHFKDAADQHRYLVSEAGRIANG